MTIDQTTWLFLIVLCLSIALVFYLRKRQIDRERARLRYQMEFYFKKDRNRVLKKLEEFEGLRRKKQMDYYDHLADALKYYAESHSRYGPK